MSHKPPAANLSGILPICGGMSPSVALSSCLGGYVRALFVKQKGEESCAGGRLSVIFGPLHHLSPSQNAVIWQNFQPVFPSLTCTTQLATIFSNRPRAPKETLLYGMSSYPSAIKRSVSKRASNRFGVFVCFRVDEPFLIDLSDPHK